MVPARAIGSLNTAWGKHHPATARTKVVVNNMTHLVQEDILPIIMIRDPLLWMQSMVRRYVCEYFYFLGSIILVVGTHGLVEYHSTMNRSCSSSLVQSQLWSIVETHTSSLSQFRPNGQ
jgi:hypothetical protein